MKKILSLVLALCMALCMVSFASAEEVPTLKIITLGNGQPDNYSAWIEHLNPYIEEKIGARLDVECIGWGDWGSRRSVIINTNEAYDVIFGDSCVRTSPWARIWTSPTCWLTTLPACWS